MRQARKGYSLFAPGSGEGRGRCRPASEAAMRFIVGLGSVSGEIWEQSEQAAS